MLGRTARVAYKNPKNFAEIVGLPVDLIEDMAIMIDALSSGYNLNADAFQNLAESWMDRFHETDMVWNWFSPYVHLLLVHGADIIRALPLAPGLLSEEPSEHLNKLVRKYRLHHARKTSVHDNLEDVVKRCLQTSDPVVLKVAKYIFFKVDTACTGWAIRIETLIWSSVAYHIKFH